jgi:hypothetical protein
MLCIIDEKALQPVVAGGLGHYRDHSPDANSEGLVDFCIAASAT